MFYIHPVSLNANQISFDLIYVQFQRAEVSLLIVVLPDFRESSLSFIISGLMISVNAPAARAGMEFDLL